MFRSTSLDNRDGVTRGNSSRRLPNQSWQGPGLGLDNGVTKATSTLPSFNNNSKIKSDHSSSIYEIRVEVHEKESQDKKSGKGSTREAGLAKLASIDEILEYEQELALEEAMGNFSVL